MVRHAPWDIDCNYYEMNTLFKHIQHAHFAKLRSRKELVQEIESSGETDATYAVVTAMRNSATYHNALIDMLIADAIEHSTLVGTVISRGKPVTHNESLYQPPTVVVHNGNLWECVSKDNHWEPGTVGEDIWKNLGPA